MTGKVLDCLICEKPDLVFQSIIDYIVLNGVVILKWPFFDLLKLLNCQGELGAIFYFGAIFHLDTKLSLIDAFFSFFILIYIARTAQWLLKNCVKRSSTIKDIKTFAKFQENRKIVRLRTFQSLTN